MTQHLTIRHVQIQTISWCNRSCVFCPSQKFELERTLMSLQVYNCLLEELRRIEYSWRFSPYLMNEPLLDQRLPCLIELARKALPQALFFINTNGDALTLELAIQLYESGLDHMIINCYDNKRNRVDRIQELAWEVCAPVSGAKVVDPDFASLVAPTLPSTRQPRIAVCDATEWSQTALTNRAGNVPGSSIPLEPLAMSCFRPFEQLYVRHNGDVVLCCCDWKGEVVFGNITHKSVPEILNSEIATMYRRYLSAKYRHRTVCRN